MEKSVLHRLQSLKEKCGNHQSPTASQTREKIWGSARITRITFLHMWRINYAFLFEQRTNNFPEKLPDIHVHTRSNWTWRKIKLFENKLFMSNLCWALLMPSLTNWRQGCKRKTPPAGWEMVPLLMDLIALSLWHRQLIYCRRPRGDVDSKKIYTTIIMYLDVNTRNSAAVFFHSDVISRPLFLDSIRVGREPLLQIGPNWVKTRQTSPLYSLPKNVNFRCPCCYKCFNFQHFLKLIGMQLPPPTPPHLSSPNMWLEILAVLDVSDNVHNFSKISKNRGNKPPRLK